VPAGSALALAPTGLAGSTARHVTGHLSLTRERLGRPWREMQPEGARAYLGRPLRDARPPARTGRAAAYDERAWAPAGVPASFKGSPRRIAGLAPGRDRAGRHCDLLRRPRTAAGW